jgi:hypothetical protein
MECGDIPNTCGTEGGNNLRKIQNLPKIINHADIKKNRHEVETVSKQQIIIT